MDEFLHIYLYRDFCAESKLVLEILILLGVAIFQKSSQWLPPALVSIQIGRGHLDEHDKNVLIHADPVPELRSIWNISLNAYFPISFRNYAIKYQDEDVL